MIARCYEAQIDITLQGLYMQCARTYTFLPLISHLTWLTHAELNMLNTPPTTTTSKPPPT